MVSSMADRDVQVWLQALLNLEQSLTARRALEGASFVSPSARLAMRVVRDVAERSFEHEHWLVDLIRGQGGLPGPRHFDVKSGDMHYQSIETVLARVHENLAATIDRYERAASRLGPAPKAAALVGRIVTRHKEGLRQLGEILASV